MLFLMVMRMLMISNDYANDDVVTNNITSLKMKTIS